MKLIKADELKEKVMMGLATDTAASLCEIVDGMPAVPAYGYWIPIDQPPKVEKTGTSKRILLSMKDYPIPFAGAYVVDQEGNGVYGVYVDGKRLVAMPDIFIGAWMPLPEPYREKEND